MRLMQRLSSYGGYKMYLFDNKDDLIYHCGGGLYLKADEKEYFVVSHITEEPEKDTITEWLDDNFDSADIVHIKHGI